MNSAQAGWLVARDRLLAPRVAIALVGAAGCVLVLGWLERSQSSTVAQSQVLRMTSGLVVPLWTYWLVLRAAGRGHLSSSIEPLARVGIDRKRSLLWLLTVVGVAAAGSSAVLMVFGLWSTSGAGAPLGTVELGAAMWVGAAGGACYAAMIGCGMTFGQGGRGGAFVLLLDWILGTGTSAVAILWPRAYMRQLLGGDAVMGLPPWGASMALVVLLGLYTGWIALRTPR